MNFSFFIARRYLFSKRKKNFINIISMLSMVVVAFTTAALVIVLSIFNGIGDLVHSLNNSFDPEIKIVAREGKSFLLTPDLLRKTEQTPGVAIVTEVIEDYAGARYRDAEQIVTLKGVGDNFLDQQRIPLENIVEGKLVLKEGGVNYAIVGQNIRYTMSIATGDNMFALQLFYIKNLKIGTDPSNMYNKKNIIPGGVFSIVQTFDESYVLVPLDFAKELFNYGDKRTSLEVKIKAGSRLNDVEERLQQTLGNKFDVLTHEEQHKDLYALIKMEKLFIFLSLSLLLLIGSINIFFSLMMLALDKKKDISVLSALGASSRTIRNIFLAEGALIAFAGAFLGLLLGSAFCLLQQRYGILSMGMESSIMEGYPIKLQLSDLVLTLAVTSIITFLISFRPAAIASRFSSVEHL